MRFIKNHKLISGLIIFLIIFLLTGVVLAFVLSKEDANAYGDRLRGIESVKISSDKEARIESEIKNLDKVNNVEYILEGRLVNILITVDKDLKLSKAKEYGDKVLDVFDDKELAYYDIQIFVLCDEKSDTYPAIGYKHKASEKLYWSNNKSE